MNPLTLIKRIQNINSREAQLGISEEASWHAKYKDSAYVYVGGVPFDLTEGDLLAVFAQYGEIVDVNLVRDKATGKSKGFAFVAYEDQRSTVLAVDNLNGAQILGRTIRVDHVDKYKKKAEEDEEEEQRKREERGVCRAFQRGECTRGDACRFSHNEKRAANTGWGDQDSKWERGRYDGPRNSENKAEEDKEEEQRKRQERGVCRAFQRGECTREDSCRFSHNEQRAADTGWGDQDSKLERGRYDGPRNGEKRPGSMPSNRVPEHKVQEDFSFGDKGKGYRRAFESHPKRSDGRDEKRLGRYGDDAEKFELRSRDNDRGEENRSRRCSEDDELGPNSREDYGRREEQGSRRHNDHEFQPKPREDRDRREDKRPRRRGDEDEFEPKLKSREDYDRRGDDRREGRRRRTDGEFEPKSREDRDRREVDSREENRLRRHNDYEHQPKSREDHDRREEQRSRRRNDDELELKSRARVDKREGERLRRHEDDEVQPKSREVRRR